jgi:hypothetical protein
MRLGIDIDNVIYDFTGAFARYVGRDPATIKRWAFYEDWGHTDEWFLSECRDAIKADKLFRFGDLMDGVKDAFDRILNMGHEIHLVTDRCSLDPEDTGLIVNHTEVWLRENELGYHSLHFTGQKDQVAKELELDFFLDDKIENFLMVDPHVRFNYLFTQPWNEHRAETHRIAAWPDFVKAVWAQTTARVTQPLTIPSIGGYVTLDSGEREEFASGMQRDTEAGKLRFDLIPRFMLNRVAGLYTRGAEKYSDNNWMKATGEAELRRFRSSANRHFEQWFQGDTDEDHAAAVFFNMAGAEYVKAKMCERGESVV